MQNEIHVLSATALRDGQLAMCGKNLGPYAEASQVHPVGNYLTPTSPDLEKVTCQYCRTTILGRLNKSAPL